MLDSLEPIIRSMQTALNLATGPGFAAALCELGAEQYMIVTAHHLLTDPMSWRILLEDLEHHLKTGKLLHSKSISFQSWIEKQANYIAQLHPSDCLPYDVLDSDYTFWGIADTPNRL